MTLDQLKEEISRVSEVVALVQSLFSVEKLLAKKSELEQVQSAPDFYTNLGEVERTGKALAALERKLSSVTGLQTQLQNIEFLADEATEQDQSILEDLEPALKKLAKQAESLRLEGLLKGKYDNLGAILTIQAGAGGTEAQDWTDMLLRMYQRYIQKRGWTYEVLDLTEGDTAGIKGATLRVEGENVYGYLKAEKGVHRLVRISPFDSNARRHTSFASVEVMPEIKKDTGIEIRQEDLKIDTFHSGGCGGQGVNTTDSAVRIRHIPTGIVVQCQNQRSQIQNRENAMAVLRSKLAQREEEKQQQALSKIQGTMKKIEWGSQIRSYVFHPYNMVKDHRTNWETSDTQGFMNGELQECIEDYLKQTA